MIFSPLKPIFPLETKKVALYAPEQNVPTVRQTEKPAFQFDYQIYNQNGL